MLRKVTAIFLLITFMAQTFHRAIIVIAFYGNQDYIAKNLCENRFRPKLKCNGQCHLAKKLQQEEKRDQSNPERKLENKNEVFSSAYDQPVFVDIGTPNVSNFNIFNTGTPMDIAGDFFHPPSA